MEHTIRNYDINHSMLINIIPRMQIEINQNLQQFATIDCTHFFDAWETVEHHDQIVWACLFLTHKHVAKIVLLTDSASMLNEIGRKRHKHIVVMWFYEIE